MYTGALCALLLSAIRTAEISPTDLAEAWKKAGSADHAVVDPQNLLSADIRKDILTNMKDMGAFSAIFVVVGSIPPKYIDAKKEVNLSRFSKDLGKMLSISRRKWRKTILLVFSLDHSMYRFRMGKTLAQTLTPSEATKFVQNIQPELAKKNYDAFAKLLKEMSTKVREKLSLPAKSTQISKVSMPDKSSANSPHKSIVGKVLIFVALTLIGMAIIPLLWFLGVFKTCFGKKQGADVAEHNISQNTSVHPQPSS